MRLGVSWFPWTILDIVADILRWFGFDQSWRWKMFWLEFDKRIGDTFKFVAAAILVLADHGIQVAETLGW